MKIKTSELIGRPLNWAVAECEGGKRFLSTRKEFGIVKAVRVVPDYANNWFHGCPIIDREGIGTFRHHRLDESQPFIWGARMVVSRPNLGGVPITFNGPSLLIAAMRCYVASKMGDIVEIPDEVLSIG